jgi:5-methylcytosine-specific restriction endonuclease McrA
LYYIQVWVITESQPLHVLRNYEKRCFRGKDCYHLDHIVPISHGFYNKIPPEKIGGMSNLRFIKSERNMRKGHRLTTESHKVLRKIRRRI